MCVIVCESNVCVICGYMCKVNASWHGVQVMCTREDMVFEWLVVRARARTARQRERE